MTNAEATKLFEESRWIASYFPRRKRMIHWDVVPSIRGFELPECLIKGDILITEQQDGTRHYWTVKTVDPLELELWTYLQEAVDRCLEFQPNPL